MPSGTTRNFNLAVLPWMIALAALVLYGLTLNHWVSLASLPMVAKVTGWDWWTPNLVAPLHYALTYPIRFAPANWQPLALNAFAALCATLSLALLARSVALLPHDRTREQRQRERSELSLLSLRTNWVPPVFAVALFAFQLTFWEHAIVATGEALNLLLFAYVIRCLLEFRVQQKESWLWRMALVYGLAITNNWAMIGFFPLMLVALVWIRGRSFFQWKFLGKMTACGAAGLLLYLLLPLIGALAESPRGTFWELLRTEWSLQKQSLFALPKWVLVILVLPSLLPVLSMGIRWPSNFGDVSAAGNTITNLMFRVVHAMFLGICVWVMFDPPFSPRALGMGFPFLTFYYLSALAAGYFLGYFLLVLSGGQEKGWRRSSALTRAVTVAALAAVWAGSLAVPLALAWHNLPKITAANGQSLQRFASHATEPLIGKGAVILSDEPMLLLLAEGMLRRNAAETDHLLVDVRSLPYSLYHRLLAKKYPGKWPEFLAGENVPDRLPPLDVAKLIGHLAQTREVFYLHPTFGQIYLEHFNLEPHGLVFKVTPPAPADAASPERSARLLARREANDRFWASVAEDVSALRRPISNQVPEALALGRFYSRGLNYWGVELQRAGELDPARRCFELALDLNPENPTALVNRRFHDQLRGETVDDAEIQKALDFTRSRFRTWSALLRENGPFDEPSSCQQLGEAFLQFNLLRQAGDQFARAHTLAPDNPVHQISRADIFLRRQMPDRCLETIATVRTGAGPDALSPGLQTALVRLEAMSWFHKKEREKAETLLKEAQAVHPRDPGLLDALSQIYLLSGQFDQALAALDQQLQLSPRNLRALLNKGALQIQMRRYDLALPPLDQALGLEPNNEPALMNRAVANLNLDRLDAAQRDYETLQKIRPRLHSIYYGLGEIARRRKDTNEAVRQFELALRYAPGNASDRDNITGKINELKGSGN